ncbi:unnamed protein product [Rotaria sordida]|uniref:Uncharacterized protein n=1 Tax=Rotaria sordida TaxID=392033 RepID=A0A815TE91_9BILA|nr:unnamed protein product [Rotaria sordida]CAF1500867.1 unnamed protein product [Rotaria sordida]
MIGYSPLTKNNCQSHLRSAKLIDNNIFKLTSYDGFSNSSLLFDSTWLKGKITNNEYRQAIEQINQRIGQSLVGASNNLPLNQIPITQSTILAIEELNFFLLILNKTFFIVLLFLNKFSSIEFLIG